MRTPRLAFVACALLAVPAAAQEKPAKPEKPKLTAIERAQGWRFLFDGGSLSDWRGYAQNKVPASWTVVDGWLTNGGDTALVSEEEYGDFELQFDWRAGEEGVCQVYLRAGEDTAKPEESGLLVDLAGGEGMGGNGGLTPLWRSITPQPGLWYRSKVTVYGNQVEHWINGDKVLTYTIGSPDWKTALAGSRFGPIRNYGEHGEGRIVLAGKGAAFRNIKVRGL